MQKARNLAEQAVRSFDGAGIYGVEMFLTGSERARSWCVLCRFSCSLGPPSKIKKLLQFCVVDGDVLLNEVAPRPHNSGHYTIEACFTSQFEQHLRAIFGLPLGDTELKVQCASMVNILGTGDGEFERTTAPLNRAMILKVCQHLPRGGLVIHVASQSYFVCLFF